MKFYRFLMTVAVAIATVTVFAGVKLAPAHLSSFKALQRYTSRPAKVAVDVKKPIVNPFFAVSTKADATMLLEEDFSRFTAGSEATPDATDISDVDTGAIADSYTATPGWYGAAVYQAGGCAYIGMFDFGYGDEPGYIQLPIMEGLSTYEVTFRARSAVEGSTDTMYVVGFDSNSDSYEYEIIDITDNWAEYSITLTSDYSATGIQLYTMTNDFYIDDISLKSIKTGIAAPKALAASNVTATGFTANWEAVADATDYQLSVFSHVEGVAAEEGSVTEGFDGIAVTNKKFIDAANSTFPEGWTISVSEQGTSREVYNSSGNYLSPSISLAFDASGDYVETPEAPARISGVSFWCKAQGADEMSEVKVMGVDGELLTLIGSVYPNSLDAAGEVVSFTVPMDYNFTKVRLVYVKSVGNCSIDDVTYNYGGTSVVRSYLMENQSVGNVTSYDVTADTESTQYYYYVTASDDQFTSTPSAVIVVGEGGGDEPIDTDLPAPVALPATDVTDNGYTANWEAVDKANLYLVYSNIDHTAPVDETYYLVNDDFSGITEGTEDNPGVYMYYGFLDEWMTRSDWYAVMPSFVEGYLGLDNSLGDYGYPASLSSPSYDLTNDGGKVKVQFRVKGTDISKIAVYLFDEETETAGTPQLFDVTADWSDITVDLEGGTTFCYISIEAYEGAGTFYVDDLKVSQNLKAGNTLQLSHGYAETDATSQYFATTDKVEGDSFFYYVIAVNYDFDNDEILGWSSGSNDMYVEDGGSVKAIQGETYKIVPSSRGIIVATSDNDTVSVYDVNGRCIYSSQGCTHNIALSRAAVYVVKVGNDAVKIVR